MKKALKFTAKATWFMMKTLVKAAWLLPGAVRKAVEHDQAPRPTRVNMPSPNTAFPAP